MCKPQEPGRGDGVNRKFTGSARMNLPLPDAVAEGETDANGSRSAAGFASQMSHRRRHHRATRALWRGFCELERGTGVILDVQSRTAIT